MLPNFYALSGAVNAATGLFALSLLLLLARRVRGALPFAFFLFWHVVWSLSYFFWQSAQTPEAALLWLRLLMTGAIFLPPSFWVFCASIAEASKIRRVLSYTSFIYIIPALYLNWTSSLFYGSTLTTKLGIPWWPTAGILFYPFVAVFILIFLAAITELYRGQRNNNGKHAAVLRVLYITTMVSWVGGLVNYFLWFNIPIPPITTLLGSVYTVSATVLLIRGKLFGSHIFYFEIASTVLVFLSAMQFIAGGATPGYSVNVIFFCITIFLAYLFLRVGTRERAQQKKIQELNAALEGATSRVINSVNVPIIIASENGVVVAANARARSLFGIADDSPPLALFDFVRSKANPRLAIALSHCAENKTGEAVSAEMHVPAEHRFTITSSPFPFEEAVSATIFIFSEEHTLRQ